MLKLTPSKIVAVYFLLGVIWITSSDLILALITKDTGMYTLLSIAKGWLFILVTAVLLHGLVREYASRRNRAEEVLKVSEERFRDLAESLPQTVFEVDLAGTVTYVNKAGQELFGYTSQDVKDGVNFMEIIAPDDREKARENMERRLRGENRFSFEYRALRKDGSAFPTMVHSISILQNGRAVGLRGILLDMTERNQSEKALRESEEKYRFLVEHANDGVIIAQDAALRYANPMMSSITGYSYKELTTKPFTDFLHPEDRAMVLERHIKRMRGEIDQTFTYTFRLLTRDGRTVWIETRGP